MSGGNGFSLTIGECRKVVSDANLGDSICVNGVCLTITEIDGDTLKFGVSPETLRRSNLGELKAGSSRVNLERAVRADTRMGGHMVQGHVDTVATVTEIEQDGNSIRYTFSLANDEFLKYIIEKGFIALDGTSLTVTAVTDASFSIMMVRYTQDMVIMPSKRVGDHINVEVDQIGKYCERLMQAHLAGLTAQQAMGGNGGTV